MSPLLESMAMGSDDMKQLSFLASFLASFFLFDERKLSINFLSQTIH
jgi:hypothetical protein